MADTAPKYRTSTMQEFYDSLNKCYGYLGLSVASLSALAAYRLPHGWVLVAVWSLVWTAMAVRYYRRCFVPNGVALTPPSAFPEQPDYDWTDVFEPDADPCDYCPHDNTEHAEDGCRLCPCAVPQ